VTDTAENTVAHKATTSDSATRRTFVVASSLGAFLALLLFVLIMQGSRQSFLDEDLLGGFYDAQAQSLLKGQMSVDPDVPGLEGFRIGDETQIYQGIAPAVIRMPLLVLTDRFAGRLTGVSMLLAFSTSLAFLIAAGWRIRSLLRDSAAIRSAEAVCTGIVAFGIAGSSLLFLSSATWVYHEALLWGAAFSIASLTSLFYWLAPTRASEPKARLGTLLLAVIFAGLSVNTRSSIGLGPLAALGLTAACLILGLLVDNRRGRSRRQSNPPEREQAPLVQRISGWDSKRSTTRPVWAISVILIGALAAVVLYAAVNFARFDSWFGVPLDKQVLVDFDPIRLTALEANGNTLFGLKYAPSVLLQALRPDALSFGSEFPFVGFPNQKPALIGSAMFAERDWSSSLPSSQPLLFFAGCLGVLVLLIPKKLGVQPDVKVLRIPVIGAAAGGALFIAFGYISERYLTDLFPFLALVGLVGLQALAALVLDQGKPPQENSVSLARKLAGPALVIALVVGSLFSVWVNASLALQYGLVIAPSANEAQRSRWLDVQDRLGGRPELLRVSESSQLPEPGPKGQVLIVGECEEMYRSSGATWYLLEDAGDSGTLQVVLRKTAPIVEPTAVLASGSQASRSSLMLQPLGQSRYRLFVQTVSNEGTKRSFNGKPFTLLKDEPRTLTALMTPRLGAAVVFDQQSGRELLRVTAPLPSAPFEPVGSANLQVRTSATTTTACEQFLG
jgi:hypothetical protein